VDVEIDDCDSVKIDESVFQWKSLARENQGKNAICVSLSIDNAMRDINVKPSANNRKHLYSIFIQTESIE
jgi:hypothetical protein